MKKPTENIVREKLQALEYPHNNQAWAALQERMAQPVMPKTEKSDRRRWLLFALLGSFAALAIVATGWLYQSLTVDLGQLKIEQQAAEITRALTKMPLNDVYHLETTAAAAISPISTGGNGAKSTLQSAGAQAAPLAALNKEVDSRPHQQESPPDAMADQARGTLHQPQGQPSRGFISELPLLEARPLAELDPIPGEEAQSLEVIPVRSLFRHSLSMELLGGSGWGGLRYERKIGRQLLLSVGLGLYAENQLHLTLPVGLAFEKPMGRAATDWRWGAGTTLTYLHLVGNSTEQVEQPFWTVFPHLRLTRYNEKGFVLKVKGGVLVESARGVGTFWGGLSVGRTF